MLARLKRLKVVVQETRPQEGQGDNLQIVFRNNLNPGAVTLKLV